MRIGEERVGGALVIAPEGRLDSVSSGELERLVVSRIDAGEKRLVVDLSAVEYISSAGLRVLLMAAKRLKGPPAAVVLCGMGPSVRTVLELAGFLPLFAVEAGREQALARVRG
ncbi:MAG TPA: STAS domain-containing protein [Vicinamibacteria bacterium]|nr:STAS domain-containing protein [Vicinamibacteria bacterium]